MRWLGRIGILNRRESLTRRPIELRTRWMEAGLVGNTETAHDAMLTDPAAVGFSVRLRSAADRVIAVRRA